MRVTSWVGKSRDFQDREKAAPFRIFPTANGMYRVGGSINGFPVDFLVDTGATLIAMNRNEARRLGINFRVDGQNPEPAQRPVSSPPITSCYAK